MRSDWTLPICAGDERLKGADGQKAHPTQKPESLLHRVIVSSTRPGDVVLDPFFGSGTTGAVAKRLGRRFIGIEREEIRHGRGRASPACRSCPAGDGALRDRARGAAHCIRLAGRARAVAARRCAGHAKRHKAKVRADGAVSLGDSVGSIHQIGAHVQGLDACNGWTFWQFETPKGLTLIDELRAVVRSEMAEAAK